MGLAGFYNDKLLGTLPTNKCRNFVTTDADADVGMLTLMLRRTGRVAVATVAAVVGVADDIDDVADNADDVLGFALFFLEGWFI